MHALPHVLALTAPLFALAFLGYALVRWRGWPDAATDGLSRFVFAVAVPALLFRMMAGFAQLPAVDLRLLLAYFGGCFIVFAIGRLVGRAVFGMDGAAQSVFGMGGVFANTVLVGLPLAHVTLGEAAIPPISLVIVFNALILWTVVTVSVEWARGHPASLAGLARTALRVVGNPVVGSILAGIAFGYSALPLPQFVDRTLNVLAQAAAPLSLVALGMELGGFRVREGLPAASAIAVVKLALFPLVVWGLARLIGLRGLETQAIVMLASLPVGANVYLMARQFGALEGTIAASLVLTTALAAVTTPLAVALSAG
jgi:malonate transporter